MIETFRDDVLSSLTPSELDFLYYSELHLAAIARMTVDEAASASLASPAVIERACAKLGLSGFAELRFLVRSELKGQSVASDAVASGYRAASAAESLVRETSIAYALRSEERLAEAARHIHDARNLVLFGRGLSEFPAEYLSEYLGRMGRTCRRYLDPPFVYRDAARFNDRDVLVIFSSGGRTIPVMKAATIAAKSSASVIAICSDPDSPLCRVATLPLIASADMLRISQIDLNSRYTQFLIADALIDSMIGLLDQHEA